LPRPQWRESAGRPASASPPPTSNTHCHGPRPRAARRWPPAAQAAHRSGEPAGVLLRAPRLMTQQGNHWPVCP
jgi:hypothetical protein